MIFDTRVNNIPCQCHVIYYLPPIGKHTPAEFEFTLLDRKGYRAEWLDKYVDDSVIDKLLMEYLGK